jgi:DNA-binding CsgD family transcriptional regulator
VAGAIARLAPIAPAASAGSSTEERAEGGPQVLTPREREILAWMASGLQNKEIAQRLGLSLATVRNHIHNTLEKLGLHSKLEAVSLAYRNGWVAASTDAVAREEGR